MHDDPRICTPERNNVCGFLEVFAGLDIDRNRFLFRRDTLHTLVEIVQETMIRLLGRAHSVSCTVASVTGMYPIMTCEIFQHGTATFLKDLLPTEYGSVDYEFVMATLGLLPGNTRETIIRRLSHRAGIVRMDNDVSELAWGTFIHIILLVIRTPCMDMVGYNKRDEDDANEKLRILELNDTIRTVPPLSVTGVCSSCFQIFHIHTLVLQQMEDSAKMLGLVHKVYGDFWLVPGACVNCELYWENARDALIAKAEEEYEYEKEEYEMEEEDDLCMEYYEDDSGCLCTCVMMEQDSDSENGSATGDAEEDGSSEDGGELENDLQDGESENDADDDYGRDLGEDTVDDFQDMDLMDSSE